MSEVLIAGMGMTTFGKHENESLEDLGSTALLEALAEAGLEPAEIDSAVSSNVLGGGAVGQRVLERVGLLGIPVINVENACASGSTAVHLAAASIASGAADAVVVLGVERMTGLFQGGITLDRSDRPTAIGLTMPAIYALWADAYARRHGVPVEDLARISVKNRRYGAANPLAMFRAEVTAEEVLASKPVADPLTLLQCCANSDGAAALVLVGDRFRSRFRGAARVVGTGLSSGRPVSADTDLSRLDVSRRSAAQAFRTAGLTPSAVGLAEIHDAFTIGEVLATEAIGLADAGRALRDDLVPINVSGGLLSKGHPVGATGVAQVVELARQVTGSAGDRQIDGVRVAVAHTVGGGVGTLEAIASGTVLVSV
jgi:acetyl-CoA acetyltransferase